MELKYPLQLEPQYRDYVWGGQRLRPGILTAEAWIVYEGDRVRTGPFAGRTLAELAEEYGPALLGARVVERSGNRFPLLIKLLDCAQWLSLQVHPDDRQAEELEGPGHFGKTEAWHVLDAAPDAQLIAGLVPGTSPDAVTSAIRGGTILDLSQYLPVRTGDTVFIRAGTIHALGPGLLIYEIQQTSDITYRVFDWNRPQTSGRVLHIDKSLAVADPAAIVRPLPRPEMGDGERKKLCASPYFTLELLSGQGQEIALDTGGQTFHTLTVIEGAATVEAGGETVRLERFESVVIPSAVGEYRVKPVSRVSALKGSVE